MNHRESKTCYTKIKRWASNHEYLFPKRVDQEVRTKTKGWCVAVGSKQGTYGGYDKMMDCHRWSLLTASLLQESLRQMTTGPYLQQMRGTPSYSLMMMSGFSCYYVTRWQNLWYVSIQLYTGPISQIWKTSSYVICEIVKGSLWYTKGCSVVLQETQKRPHKHGVQSNPYNNPCMANSMVNGAQCTVCWHVDDLKVSHVDAAVVTAFSFKLADLYKGKG